MILEKGKEADLVHYLLYLKTFLNLIFYSTVLKLLSEV